MGKINSKLGKILSSCGMVGAISVATITPLVATSCSNSVNEIQGESYIKASKEYNTVIEYKVSGIDNQSVEWSIEESTLSWISIQDGILTISPEKNTLEAEYDIKIIAQLKDEIISFNATIDVICKLEIDANDQDYKSIDLMAGKIAFSDWFTIKNLDKFDDVVWTLSNDAPSWASIKTIDSKQYIKLTPNAGVDAGPYTFSINVKANGQWEDKSSPITINIYESLYIEGEQEISMAAGGEAIEKTYSSSKTDVEWSLSGNPEWVSMKAQHNPNELVLEFAPNKNVTANIYNFEICLKDISTSDVITYTISVTIEANENCDIQWTQVPDTSAQIGVATSAAFVFRTNKNTDYSLTCNTGEYEEWENQYPDWVECISYESEPQTLKINIAPSTDVESGIYNFTLQATIQQDYEGDAEQVKTITTDFSIEIVDFLISGSDYITVDAGGQEVIEQYTFNIKTDVVWGLRSADNSDLPKWINLIQRDAMANLYITLNGVNWEVGTYEFILIAECNFKDGIAQDSLEYPITIEIVNDPKIELWTATTDDEPAGFPEWVSYTQIDAYNSTLVMQLDEEGKNWLESGNVFGTLNIIYASNNLSPYEIDTKWSFDDSNNLFKQGSVSLSNDVMRILTPGPDFEPDFWANKSGTITIGWTSYELFQEGEKVIKSPVETNLVINYSFIV